MIRSEIRYAEAGTLDELVAEIRKNIEQGMQPRSFLCLYSETEVLSLSKSIGE